MMFGHQDDRPGSQLAAHTGPLMTIQRGGIEIGWVFVAFPHVVITIGTDSELDESGDLPGLPAMLRRSWSDRDQLFQRVSIGGVCGPDRGRQRQQEEGQHTAMKLEKGGTCAEPTHSAPGYHQWSPSCPKN